MTEFVYMNRVRSYIRYSQQRAIILINLANDNDPLLWMSSVKVILS